METDEDGFVVESDQERSLDQKLRLQDQERKRILNQVSTTLI